MPDVPRLLFVHAHPDDETLTTGVTIAHYAARGAEVRVVTCTLGEEGEVIGERYARLAVDAADQLGGYRIAELTAALAALGAGEPMFLGGAGRWRDSGMPGTPARRHPQFSTAEDHAVGALVAIIRDLRPHVVVGYDPGGGYGHPDHVHAHTVTTAAVRAAAGRAHPGDPWSVPKFYWTVTSASAAAAGLRALRPDDLAPDWIQVPGEVQFGYPDHQIHAVIDDPTALPAKVAALRAHATQVSVGPTEKAFALSNRLALPVLTAEHYVLVAGAAGQRDARGWETDLLAGVDLTASATR